MDEKLCKNFYKLCKIDEESENVYDNSGYKDGEKPDRRKFEKQKEKVLKDGGNILFIIMIIISIVMNEEKIFIIRTIKKD